MASTVILHAGGDRPAACSFYGFAATPHHWVERALAHQENLVSPLYAFKKLQEHAADNKTGLAARLQCTMERYLWAKLVLETRAITFGGRLCLCACNCATAKGRAKRGEWICLHRGARGKAGTLRSSAWSRGSAAEISALPAFARLLARTVAAACRETKRRRADCSAPKGRGCCA